MTYADSIIAAAGAFAMPMIAIASLLAKSQPDRIAAITTVASMFYISKVVIEKMVKNSQPSV